MQKLKCYQNNQVEHIFLLAKTAMPILQHTVELLSGMAHHSWELTISGSSNNVYRTLVIIIFFRTMRSENREHFWILLDYFTATTVKSSKQGFFVPVRLLTLSIAPMTTAVVPVSSSDYLLILSFTLAIGWRKTKLCLPVPLGFEHVPLQLCAFGS